MKVELRLDLAPIPSDKLTESYPQMKSPVLILSCHRDLIEEEHTLFIYRNIPKSNLCIFPGETHWITSNNTDLFNSTVTKFFSGLYRRHEMRQ